MGLRVLLMVSLVGIGCGKVEGTPRDAPAGDDGDVAPDGPGPGGRCDPAKPFGAPTLVANVSSSNEEFGFSLTRDERFAFVGHVVQPPTPSAVILATERQPDGTFARPSGGVASAINQAPGDEHAPSPVADGLIMYFHRQDAAGIGILAAVRPDATSAFSSGAVVTVGGTGLGNALSPTISADGQTLYWLDFQDFRVRSAARGNTPTTFGPATVASTIAIAGAPVLSADELTLFYANGNGEDVLVSTRASKGELFGTGVPLANVNSPSQDRPVWLSNDGCVLFLSSNRPGGLGGADIWEARRSL